MAQLAQRLGLDLADAFARDVELLADLLERAGTAVLDAEAELEDLLLARGEGGEHVHKLLLQQRERRGLARLARALIGDEVAKVAVFLFAISAEISSGEGSWPRDWSSWRETRMTLLMVSTMWTGMRMVRAWSAMARVMA